jgi:hypothetical protein
MALTASTPIRGATGLPLLTSVPLADRATLWSLPTDGARVVREATVVRYDHLSHLNPLGRPISSAKAQMGPRAIQQEPASPIHLAVPLAFPPYASSSLSTLSWTCSMANCCSSQGPGGNASRGLLKSR